MKASSLSDSGDVAKKRPDQYRIFVEKRRISGICDKFQRKFRFELAVLQLFAPKSDKLLARIIHEPLRVPLRLFTDFCIGCFEKSTK